LLVRNPKPTPYDNSLTAVQEAGELSRRIVHWGSTLVQAGHCEVVCAYEVPYIERLRLCDLSNATITACSEEQEKSVQRAIGALLCAAEASTQIHAHVIRGAALPVILAEITRYGSQVLIVGRHEHRPDGAGHALMGCVGVRLAYHARIVQKMGRRQLARWLRLNVPSCSQDRYTFREMSPLLLPFQLVLLMFSGWVNRHQLDVIEYLQEENRVLKARMGGKHLRFTDAERSRLARKAHALGRKVLSELDTLVTPDTLL
jgi:hypothetical protein